VAKLGSLRPLRHPAFRAVWFGSLVSNVGTWMQTAALGYYVAHLTHSAAWSAVTAAAEFAPTALLGPIGGALADRMSRRALFLAGTIAQLVLATLLTIAMVASQPGAPAVALYALANGCVFALVFPAFNAIMPDLVPEDELPGAIGLNSAQWNLGRVVGPVLGSLIYYFAGISWVIGVNAASFLAVVIALLRVEIPRPAPADGPILTSILEGWRFVRREPGLRLVLYALTLNTLCIAPFIGLIPAMVVKVFHGGTGSVGVLITAQGLGAVVTGLSFANVTERYGIRRVMIAAVVGLPFTVSAYAIAPNVAFAAVGLFFTGMLYFAAMSSFSTIAQLRAPSEYRGRTLSVNQVVLGVGYVIGLNVQGPLGDSLGVRQVTILFAALSLTIVAATWASRRGITRVLDRQPEPALAVAVAGR
jgi:MFS family permease